MTKGQLSIDYILHMYVLNAYLTHTHIIHFLYIHIYSIEIHLQLVLYCFGGQEPGPQLFAFSNLGSSGPCPGGPRGNQRAAQRVICLASSSVTEPV